MNLIFLILAITCAYLLGSVSCAVIVCKMLGLPDPRTQGSKNPGATNVLRIGGKKAAALTLVGDCLKGFIPVLLAQFLGFHSSAVAMIAFAAFIGHLYPIFFNFEGGKGVATAIGCMLALSLPVSAFWLITWAFVAITFRYSSLAALIASALAPFYFWLFTHNSAYVVMMLAMSLLLILRHRTNIQKLMAGKENRLGKKKL